MRKHKKGFTIVELVIVIAVIGILSAILIPTFVNVTANAKEAALQSDLSTSYSMYAAEAADWVVDETEKEIVFKAQAEVELSKEVTEGEGDNKVTKTYTYRFDDANKKWVEGHIYDAEKDAEKLKNLTLNYVVTINKTVKGEDGEETEELDKENSAEQSTFGGYTFKYYLEKKPTSTGDNSGGNTGGSTEQGA